MARARSEKGSRSQLPKGALRGDSVILRPPLPEDTRLLFRWLNDPEIISPRDRFELESYRTMEDALHRSSEDPASLAPRFVVELKAGRTPIGVVGYFNSYTALDSIDVWYVITLLEERGKGYGKEAVRLLVDYVFAHTTVERVGATSDVENPGSTGLLRSLGFRDEGVLKRALYHHGGWHDVAIFGITRAEWTTRS
jgi:RimJ/RimL family protein N-acetyltransferase